MKKLKDERTYNTLNDLFANNNNTNREVINVRNQLNNTANLTRISADIATVDSRIKGSSSTPASINN